MGKIEFSVVIPLYNKEKHIQRAINSVLAQTYQGFELIIVDDGSTDGSFDAASAIQDARIRIVRQENKGVSAARNRGVAETKYDWVAFLDADDEWLPEFLEAICKLMDDIPGCGLYASAYSYINSVGEKSFPPTPYPSGAEVVIEDIYRDFRLYSSFSSSSVVIYKKYLTEIFGFPEAIDQGEDIVTWMKLFLITSFALINDPLSIYHIDATERACDRFSNRLDKFPPVETLQRSLLENEIPNNYKQSAKEYIASRQINLARRNINSGNYGVAIRLLWSCRNTQEQFTKWARFFIIALAAFMKKLFLKQNRPENGKKIPEQAISGQTKKGQN